MTPADLAYASTLNLLGSDPIVPPELEASVTALRDRAAASHKPTTLARPTLTTRLRALAAKLPGTLRAGRWELHFYPYDLVFEKLPKPGCADCGDRRGWYCEDGWEHCACMSQFASRRIPWRPIPARALSDEPPF